MSRYEFECANPAIKVIDFCGYLWRWTTDEEPARVHTVQCAIIRFKGSKYLLFKEFMLYARGDYLSRYPANVVADVFYQCRFNDKVGTHVEDLGPIEHGICEFPEMSLYPSKSHYDRLWDSHRTQFEPCPVVLPAFAFRVYKREEDVAKEIGLVPVKYEQGTLF